MKKYLSLVLFLLVFSSNSKAQITPQCENVPLVQAVMAQDKVAVDFWLNSGSTTNHVNLWCAPLASAPDGSIQPIFIAASLPNTEITNTLISHGADINSIKHSVHAWMSTTVLLNAIDHVQLQQIEFLLNKGTKLELFTHKNHEPVAVLWMMIQDSACKKFSYENFTAVADILLAHGLNINERNFDGTTALTAAKNCSNEKIEKYLIDHGATL